MAVMRESARGTVPASALGVSTETAKSQKHYPLHAAVWRWHFYAGILVTPILILLSVTGALLVFEQEFDEWYYAELLKTEPHDGPLAPVSEMAATVAEELSVLGTPKVTSIALSTENDRSVEFLAEIDETFYVYAFTDPKTGAYLGHFLFEQSPMRYVEQIHRRLLFPRSDRTFANATSATGSTIVEIVTSWSIILTLTGVYLWWPKRWSKVGGVWLPRLTGSVYRKWRDWHTVPALYLSVLTLIVLFTGLLFSEWFGATFYDVTKATAGVGESPYPLYAIDVPRDPELPAMSLDDLVAKAQSLPAPAEHGLAINVPEESNRYALVTGYDRETYNPASAYYALIDLQTGEVEQELRWAGFTPMVKLRMLAYPLHVGSIFGLPTKILALLVCLGLIAVSVTGVVMWWKRRPRGAVGTPRRLRTPMPPLWVTSLILVFAVLLPTVGVTLVAALAIDRAWVFGRNRYGRAKART